MKKTLQLIAVAALFALAAMTTSCSSSGNRHAVEFTDGRRTSVETELYSAGDTVYVCTASNSYGTSVFVSTTYWHDTIYCQEWSDSTITCWSFEKAVLIN